MALEAGASGSPVIAMRKGALPELVVDGMTGYLVDLDAMVESIRNAVDQPIGLPCPCGP